jgi:Ca2+-binding EF-hand superfamily protein
MNRTLVRAAFCACCLVVLSAAAAAQDARIAKVEGLLKRHDKNGDGVVDATESKSAELFRRYDADKDGKATAAEMLIAEGGAFDEKARRRLVGRPPIVRVFSDIVAFDADFDAALDYDELKTLVFSICDGANPDGRLDRAECGRSLAPYAATFKNGWLAKDFKKLVGDGDALLMRDFDLPEGYVKALDQDGDGKASFDEIAVDGFLRRGGKVARFPAIAEYFAKSDAAKAADWPGDAADFRRFDENRDGRVVVAEFDRVVRSLRETLDLRSDFVSKFDLDGDGKVARAEFPGSDLVFARLDVDGDGVVGPKDRPR